MTESAVAAMGAAINRKETMETRQAGVPVMTASAPRTHWKVEEPEAGLRLVVAARTFEEAQAVAWRRWYGRNPATELEGVMRAALSLTGTGAPAE